MKDDGQADFTKEEIEDLYNEWIARGKPGGDKSNKPKRGGRRMCEDDAPMSDPDSPPSPNQSVEPSDDSDPTSDPDSGPQNNEFSSPPSDSSGVLNEDGTPVNPTPGPIAPGVINPTLPILPPIQMPTTPVGTPIFDFLFI